MKQPFRTRKATLDDASVLARHRVGMFRDMGSIRPAHEQALLEQSRLYFEAALVTGEYVAWIAEAASEPGKPLGGAGLQLRSMLPRPGEGGGPLLLGREGLVLNVYVERFWRRRGIARLLMRELIDWSRAHGVVRLVLHASDEGRVLYQSLGFVVTNEMRYTGWDGPNA